MIYCPVCGKPYAPGSNTSFGTYLAIPNGFCGGVHLAGEVNIWQESLGTFTIACPPEQIDVHYDYREPQQPQGQPLEWTDVEAQLDDFMAELNRGKS